MVNATVPLMTRRDESAPPVGTLSAGIFVNSLGSGLYFPLSLVLLHRLSGLSFPTVGVLLTAAMTLSLVTMPALGGFIDRWGPRTAMLAALGAQAIGFVGYTLVHAAPLFAVMATLVAIGSQTVKAAQPVLVASLSQGPARVRLIALTRSLSNAALGLGGIALAFLPATPSRAWFVGAALVNATSFLVAGAIIGRLDNPVLAATSRRRVLNPHTWQHATFRRYVFANALSSFGYAALSNLIPLMAIVTLHLPAGIAGGLFTVNTVVTAAAGVPIISLLQRHEVSNRRSSVAGLIAMATGMGGFGLALTMPHGAALLTLLGAAMIVYSLGEAVHSPSSTTMALDVAPATERGQFQSVYQMSWGIGAAAAPALFTGLLAVGAGYAVALPVITSSLAALLLARPETEGRRIAGLNTPHPQPSSR